MTTNCFEVDVRMYTASVGEVGCYGDDSRFNEILLTCMTDALNGCKFDCCVEYWHNICPIATYFSISMYH